MQDFKAAMLADSPIVWFFFNILFWITTAYGLYKLGQYLVFLSMGKITLRVKVMQRLSPAKFNAFLQSKETSLEDKDVDDFNTVVRIMWTEKDTAAFGGSEPSVQVEYDTDTAFMHYIYISYNRHLAKADQALTAAQVRNRIAQDFVSADVFEDLQYTFEEVIIDETGEIVEDKGEYAQEDSAEVEMEHGNGSKSMEAGSRAPDSASNAGGGKGGSSFAPGSSYAESSMAESSMG